MNKPKCILCKDHGMVEMPHGSYENGFWENCPMCYPEEAKKAEKSKVWEVVWFFVLLVLGIIGLCLTFKK